MTEGCYYLDYQVFFYHSWSFNKYYLHYLARPPVF